MTNQKKEHVNIYSSGMKCNRTIGHFLAEDATKRAPRGHVRVVVSDDRQEYAYDIPARMPAMQLKGLIESAFQRGAGAVKCVGRFPSYTIESV